MPDLTITCDHVRAALALPDFDARTAWAHMELQPRPPRTAPLNPEDYRRAAVLIPLYPDPTTGALTLLLIRRTPDPGVHSGQVGFPGGAWEPGDLDDAATALREACEEVGLCSAVSVIGCLTPLYIPPSRYRVTPVIGCLAARPTWTPNPLEVAALLELSLPDLLDDSRKQAEDWPLFGRTYRVPFYIVGGHKVWGATALMLSELEMRLRAVLRDALRAAG